VIDQDRVFITAGYDAGSVMLQIKNENGQWTAEPLWQNKRLKCKMSSAVYLNGFLYGLDDGILACLNAQTGNRVWKSGRYGHGQILLRNDTLVIQAESGELVMVAADPERHRELTKIPVLPGDKTWNAPALIENWLLLRNHFEAVLLELPMVQVQ
jgi:outer membrane protein assembly factor BamB